MKERPILFSAPMVRAILNGRKTQTRRIAKIARIDPHPQNADFQVVTFENGKQAWMNSQSDHPYFVNMQCPHGLPGDRLWVREKWRTMKQYDFTPPREIPGSAPVEYDADAFRGLNGKLRPSIFIPRWASRITLEIVAVRVERLQDITQRDAIAEGAPPSHPSIDAVSAEFGHKDFSRSWYAQLWGSINGDGAWDKNPWVWVVEFKRVTNRKDA